MNEDNIKKLPMLSSGNDVDSLLKIVNWSTGFAYLACLSYQGLFLFEARLDVFQQLVLAISPAKLLKIKRIHSDAAFF